MSIVNKICYSKNEGKELLDVISVEVIQNKGIINDRYFKDNNDKDKQLTLIESENIDYFNKKLKTNIPYIDFRRNIISKGIRLNELIDTEILIGEVRIRGLRLCDPCKYLQDKLKQKYKIKNLINLYNRGGLRCEILSNGKIFINDKIVVKY